jgi:hypothetical protein
MDVKVNTKMINDLNIQHELLKTALESTDAYLGIEKQAVAAKKATPMMIHDFTYHMSRTHDALQSLGVLNVHQEYMTSHVETMSKLFNDDDANLADLPYAHLPAADFSGMDESREFRTGQKQESVVTSFAKFITEKREVFSESDINEMVDSLTWEDIVDLYSEEELIEEETEQLDEKISAQSRLKRRQGFARGKTKRNTSKGIKLRRASTPVILQKRAQLAARRAIYQRLLRGRDKSSLSASEKDRVEQQVKSMKNIQVSIATRMVPKMRSIEQKRLANYRGGAKK